MTHFGDEYHIERGLPAVLPCLAVRETRMLFGEEIVLLWLSVSVSECTREERLIFLY